MKAGSVIVDMAASALGGNVELSVPDDTIVTDNGVTIIAPTNLPATMPGGASGFYARNISALLTHFIKEGEMTFDFEDEITAGTVITHDGKVVHEADRQAAGRRRCRMSGEISLLGSLVIFILAVLVGFEVISKVPATLHTPLMSGANSIHGIVLIGGMIIAAEADDPLGYILAAIAVIFGAMNVVGGYVVTDRMLQMFRKKPTAPKADGKEA